MAEKEFKTKIIILLLPFLSFLFITVYALAQSGNQIKELGVGNYSTYSEFLSVLSSKPTWQPNATTVFSKIDPAGNALSATQRANVLTKIAERKEFLARQDQKDYDGQGADKSKPVAERSNPSQGPNASSGGSFRGSGFYGY